MRVCEGGVGGAGGCVCWWFCFRWCVYVWLVCVDSCVGCGTASFSHLGEGPVWGVPKCDESTGAMFGFGIHYHPCYVVRWDVTYSFTLFASGHVESLEEVLDGTDYICNILPSTPRTRGLLGWACILKMYEHDACCENCNIFVSCFLWVSLYFHSLSRELYKRKPCAVWAT